MNNNNNKKNKFFVLPNNTGNIAHENTPDTNYDGVYKLKDGTYVIPTDSGDNWVYQQGGGFVASGQYIYYASNGQPVTDNSGQYLKTGIDGTNQWTSTPPSSTEQHDTSNPTQSIGGQSTTKSAKKADVQPDNPNTASGGGGVPSAITDAISALENDMQTVKSDVSTDEKDIATNTKDIQSLTSEVGTLKADVGNDVSELASAQGTISSDKAQIAEQKATITSQSKQLGQNQTLLNQDKSEIENLQSTTAASIGANHYQNAQIQQLQAQITKLQQENQALTQQYNSKKDIVVQSNQTVSPTPTILSVQTFKQFTTNYYLSGVGENGYYTASTLKRMQSIISNVEVNLNAMLNGRLYERYTPGAVVFKGWGNLSPQLEEQTLYQCLTECVEYRLITQQYVNLTNSYSGTINGANNYQTQNNNVIGLRQDIQAKLSLLGLYANVLIGKKQPKSTEYQIEHDGFNTINFGNLQQWYGFIQNTPWNFTKPISFQGGMTFGGDVSFTSNVNFTNSITVPTISATNGSFSKEVQAGSLVGNSLTLKLPYAPLLNFVNMTAASLATSKIFFGVQNSPTANSSKVSVGPITGGSPIQNPQKKVELGNTPLITEVVNRPVVPTVANLVPSAPSNYDPLNEFDVYASTINLWGTQLNVGGNMTCAGKTTLSDVSINGALTFGAQSTPAFENGITVSPQLTINGTITQNIMGNDNTNVFNSPVEMGNTLDVLGSLTAHNGISLPIWGFFSNLNTLNPTNQIAFNKSSTANPMSLFANFLTPNDLWVGQTPYSALTNELGTVNAQIISGLGANSFLVEQYVYDIYDLTQASAIPGYMAPLNDGPTYIDLEKLFLNTFGQGDLTNGYSYTFQVDWQQNLGLTWYGGTSHIARNVEVLDTQFFVYNDTSDVPIAYPETYQNTFQVRRHWCSYHGNPFPNGTITSVMQPPGAYLNSSLVRFRIEVPSAIDNRQPDDSMFLHGALNISSSYGMGQYLICVFLVRYVLSLTPIRM